MEGLMDIRQVAEALRLSPVTIRLKVYKGELPYVKIGRRCLFKPEDISALVEQSYRPARLPAREHA